MNLRKVFNEDAQLEHWTGGAIDSLHGTKLQDPFIPLSDMIILLVPRAFSPVCHKELITASKLEYPVPFFAGSTDTPEVVSAWLGDTDLFPETFNYPFITVREDTLTFYGKDICLQESGNCNRVCLFFKDGHLEGAYHVPVPVERNFDEIQRIAKALYEDNDGTE